MGYVDNIYAKSALDCAPGFLLAGEKPRKAHQAALLSKTGFSSAGRSVVEPAGLKRAPAQLWHHTCQWGTGGIHNWCGWSYLSAPSCIWAFEWDPSVSNTRGHAAAAQFLEILPAGRRSRSVLLNALNYRAHVELPWLAPPCLELRHGCCWGNSLYSPPLF